MVSCFILISSTERSVDTCRVRSWTRATRGGSLTTTTSTTTRSTSVDPPPPLPPPPPPPPHGFLSPADPVIHRCRQAVSGDAGVRITCFLFVIAVFCSYALFLTSLLLLCFFVRVEPYGDFKIGTPVATLPGAWRYRVGAGTGWPSVSIL